MAIALTSRSDLEKLARADLAGAMQAGIHAGVAGWAKDKQGLGGRLSAAKLTLYGWTRRSAAYERRVERAWGSYMPYVSPRRSGYKGVGKLLWSLTVPGRGHNVYDGQATGDTVETIVTVPAARGLNFQAGKAKIRTYLDEWGHAYPLEETEIDRRMARETTARIDAAIDRTQGPAT